MNANHPGVYRGEHQTTVTLTSSPPAHVYRGEHQSAGDLPPKPLSKPQKLRSAIMAKLVRKGD